MENNNNKPHSINHLVVLNAAIDHHDHKKSDEKDCCGSCQGNGVCSKTGLINEDIFKEFKKV